MIAKAKAEYIKKTQPKETVGGGGGESTPFRFLVGGEGGKVEGGGHKLRGQCADRSGKPRSTGDGAFSALELAMS